MISRFACDQSGSVLTIAGFAFPIVLLGGAMAFEYSVLNAEKSRLQSAVDSAALAGARVLAKSLNGDPTANAESAMAEARNFVRERYHEAQSTIQVDAAALTVAVTGTTGRPLIFGRLLGRENAELRAFAKAQLHQPEACILALDPAAPSGIQLQGAASIEAPNCAIWSNSKTTRSWDLQGGSQLQITSKLNCASGSKTTVGPVVVSPAISTSCAVMNDPFAGAAVKYAAGVCKSFNLVLPSGSTEVTLTPGVYCGGLSIESRTVKLVPGIYVFQDGPLTLTSADVSIVGSGGVSLVFSGSPSGFDLKGNSKLEIRAMRFGPLANLAIVGRNASGSSNVSQLGGTTRITVESGAVYLPQHDLKMAGNSQLQIRDKNGKLVIRSMSADGLTGNPAIVVDAVQDPRANTIALTE